MTAEIDGVMREGGKLGTPAEASSRSASLYVGDLSPSVDESQLFGIFNAVAPVASIRICRDVITRRSLSYAYVNFHSTADAIKAIETLNFTPLKGTPMRIMWVQRDPALRKSGTGNIFVKNIDKSVGNKLLYDTFCTFGNILSCKIACDQQGKSLGYGFVHFESDEAANSAIEKVNGMLLNDKALYVGPFIRKNQRGDSGKPSGFTNIYVKHFPEEYEEDDIRQLFEPFGEITSIAVRRDAKKNKKFAFVNFLKPQDAANAVEQLHGLRMVPEVQTRDSKREGSQVVEGSTEIKAGETPEDKGKVDHQDVEVQEDYEQKIPGSTCSTAVASTPEDHGKHGDVSAQETKEESHENHSEEAKDANQEMGNDLEDSQKPQGENEWSMNNEGSPSDLEVDKLYVQPFQPKTARTTMLRKKFQEYKIKNKHLGTNLYVKNLDGSIGDNELRQAFEPFGTITSCKVMRNEKGESREFGFVCFLNPEEATNAVTEMHQKYFSGRPLYVGLAEKKEQRLTRFSQRWKSSQEYDFKPWARRAGGSNMGGTPSWPKMSQVETARAASQDELQRNRNSSNAKTKYSQGVRGFQGDNYRFTAQARNRRTQEPRKQPVTAGQKRQTRFVGSDGVNSPIPKNVSPHSIQKQILGEKLFPRIQQHQPELAAKITGMMLEMDNAELLRLLDSQKQLKGKVDEALRVLQAHK